MKSKELYGKKYLDIVERIIDIVPPDEDHVIVKVHACGVCGTDVNFVRDGADKHMPLGHETSTDEYV
ncbi:alcohol dehydrogenase catalytic domain-containing protein [Candidatus Latescibacterota bacterium]